MARADPPALVRCPACDALAVGSADVACCDGAMEPLDADVDAPVAEPTLDALLETVFGISGTELELCLCVVEDGDATVAELAERVGVDRSVVARHLADLVEIGVVERERRLLRQGGHVYVYAPVPEATVRDPEVRIES
ncbi:helix-turn-helix domain-containing protein [Halobellus sp. EA9]|uniref:helix-turn-helix domain-containing protein n=1 Tax=Halobellus sp. EA9 TaxID=3421647 RepID=UPI003EBE5514